MKRNDWIKIVAIGVALSLALVACDNEGEPELTTTSSVVGQTTAPETETTPPTSDDGTTTTLVGQPVDSYDIVLRESGDDGETLYIVIPPGDYTAIDLENFIGDLISNDDAVDSAEVFDDQEALDAFLLEDSAQTADDLAMIDQHHLVSLVDGRTIKFQGPYADEGQYAIGS